MDCNTISCKECQIGRMRVVVENAKRIKGQKKWLCFHCEASYVDVMQQAANMKLRQADWIAPDLYADIWRKCIDKSRYGQPYLKPESMIMFMKIGENPEMWSVKAAIKAFAHIGKNYERQPETN